MLLDGFIPVGVGDSDVGAFGLCVFGAHAPHQGGFCRLDLFHPAHWQASEESIQCLGLSVLQQGLEGGQLGVVSKLALGQEIQKTAGSANT